MEEYLTTAELAKRLKMAPGTIRNLVYQGRLLLNTHYVKPTPRKILFVWSAVNDWLYGKKPTAKATKRKGQRPKSGLINI